MVYILDKVKALEEELLERMKQQGLKVKPQILVVTRLIPDSDQATNCNQEIEPINNTSHSHILRIPFKTQNNGILRHWISRFDIYPYLHRFAKVNYNLYSHLSL